MLKEMKDTTCSVQSILAPFSGKLSADSVKRLVLTTKYGLPFSEQLQDAAEREDTILVINLAADDENAPINAYLVQNQKEKLDAAVEAIAQIIQAKEIIIVESEEIEYVPVIDVSVQTKTIKTKRSLVLREESALYHLIETGEVRSCPLEKRFLSQGYQNRPTVTADGETLCKIYAALKNTADSKLVVFVSNQESYIAEVKTDITLETLLKESGFKTEKSVLLGGLMGEFVGKEELPERVVSERAEWDLIQVFGQKDCLADKTRALLVQAQEESCGKCVLCREGSWQMMSIAQDITSGKAKREDLEMIQDIGPLIQVGAFCSFGQNMARLCVSSVQKNRLELEAHFLKKTCPAGVCKAFSKLVIDPEKCSGCTDCMEECDEDAITGKKGFIHIIDSDLCENCGKCAEVCEENAIVMQDGKIRVPKKLVKVGKFK